MSTPLWQQGFELMLYGMGTVFLFLAVLVLTTMAMSAFVQRFLPREEVVMPRQRQRRGPSAAVAAEDNRPLMAVISAAIHRHRQQNNNE